MKCTYCDAPRSSLQSKGERNGLRRFLCNNCGKYPSYSVEELENDKDISGAKILIFDIETAPLNAYVWQTGKQVVPLGNILNHSFILTWSARWLFSGRVISDAVTPKEALSRNDARLLEGIHNLLDEADIVIGHNIKNFDIKKLNTRYLANGFYPNSFYKTIDTYEVAKSYFAFESNKLDYICRYLDLPHKVETGGIALWDACVKGSKDALDTMQRYNENDVFINEEVYLKLRPFIKNHPNVNAYYETDETACPSCGSENIFYVSDYYTNVARYKSYQCMNCGSFSRSRYNQFDKNKRLSMLAGI